MKKSNLDTLFYSAGGLVLLAILASGALTVLLLPALLRLRVGHALTQKWVYDKQYGVPLARRFYQNKPLTMLDIPAVMHTHAMNIPDPETPTGAKGVGEMTKSGSELTGHEDGIGESDAASSGLGGIADSFAGIKPAAAKAIDLRSSHSSLVPEQHLADPSRVRQILINLLDNALKFTSHGHVAPARAGKGLCGLAIDGQVLVEHVSEGVAEHRLDALNVVKIKELEAVRFNLFHDGIAKAGERFAVGDGLNHGVAESLPR